MDWGEHAAKSVPVQIVPINGYNAVWLEGNFIEHVAGEQYYQTQLLQIVGARQFPLRGVAWLVPEEDNTYDSNAVRIAINQLKVGYLPRDRAAVWQPVLKFLAARYQCHVACLAEIVMTRLGALGAPPQLDVILYLPVHLSKDAKDAHDKARREVAEKEAQRIREALEEDRRQRQAAEEEAKRAEEAARRQMLIELYGEENAPRIIAREVWQGATREMIEAAHGPPCDVDEKVMKTKTRQILKYRPAGKNRYELKITLENGVVVGWEGKA